MSEPDIADAAEALIELQTELALRHHHEQRDCTPQVRINDEPVCCDCGDVIPAARLDALPYAARCVDCQTLYEQENR